MKFRSILSLSLIAFATAVLPLAAQAQFTITEVDAAGSGNVNYAADWFELTYRGSVASNISGWKMDDSSASFSLAVPLRGITNIQPGQSVIFLEGTATGTTDATIDANFISTWFGANVPAGLTVANYGGTSVGLSTSGDAVNLFDSNGNLMAGVTFGTSPTGATFDNSAGLSGLISQASVVGVNGAFTSFLTSPAGEIGSPGISPVPEPSTFALGGLGLLMGLALRKKALRAA